MKITFPGSAGIVKEWTDGVQVEDEARKQIQNVTSLPFVRPHVAVMPDVHWGLGATVGSVIPTVGAIIPAAVGVDIGCGMQAVRLALTASDLPDNLSEIRSAIEAAVPHGRTNNGDASRDEGGWRNRPSWGARFAWSGSTVQISLEGGYNRILDKHPQIAGRKAAGATIEHVGTLGSGNHFIEICLDEEDRVWVMLHSGSRGPGNRIGTYFIEKAKEEMKRWFCNIPDEDLAYLPEGSTYFQDYVDALNWAQEFASRNRQVMMDAALCVLRDFYPDSPYIFASKNIIDCHHNYVSREHHFGKNVWLTRKGAVRARVGDLGIIPGSMGTRSYIVRGKGNPDSFSSSSHGAGRAMSRTKARKSFSVEDHIRATEGVECRKDADVIDETPGAYKSIDAVMEAQKDLVEVVHALRAVLCVKG